MILDRTHKRWFIVTGSLALAATATHALYVWKAPDGPTGGSVTGMLYGIAGSALMLFAGLISARKKLPNWRIGSAQTWLRGHIWLGTLSVLLVLMHSGFRFGGPLEQALMAVVLSIAASGVFGVAVQHALTRTLTTRVPRETFFAQVPHVCAVLQLEADVAVARVCGALPISPDRRVATKERLEGLGVTGRDPLAVIYKDAKLGDDEPEKPAKPRPEAAGAGPAAPSGPRGAAPKGAVPKGTVPKGAVTAIVAEAAAPDSSEPTAKSEPKSAPAKPPRGNIVQAAVARTTGEPPAAAPLGAAAAKALTKEEKLALMRGKKPVPAATANAPAAPEAAPLSPAAKALTKEEKLALMRGKKPAPAATADAAPEAAPLSPAAAKALTKEEKLALMRGKKPAPAATADAPAAPAAAPLSPAGAKALTKEEKLALMRGKKPAPAAGADAPPSEAAAPSPMPLDKAEARERKTAELAASLSPAKAASPRPAALAEREPAAAELKLDSGSPRPGRPADAWQRLCPEMIEFHLKRVRPFLAFGRLPRGAFSEASQAAGLFANVRTSLPVEFHPALDTLADLCEERRQLAAQVRIHHWLHGWLMVHVPLSMALIVLFIAHVLGSLYF